MELPVNTILCSDCLDVMKDWPDNCVDLVLTDPPYGIKKDKWDIWKPETLELLSKLLSNGCAIFCWFSQYKIGQMQKEIEKHFNLKNIISETKSNMVVTTWDKDKLQIQWEPIFFAIKGKKARIETNTRKFQIGIHGDVWKAVVPQSNFTGHYHKQHPCQKDINICLQAISLQSNENDLILDPFCGSGTTCVVAKMLGRRYIGIDISPEYCEIARQRLEAVDTGVPVKEARAGQIPLFK